MLSQFILDNDLIDTTCERIKELFQEETGIEVSMSLVSQQRAKVDSRGRAKRFAIMVSKKANRFCREDKETIVKTLQKEWGLLE